ncbi:hypothetical protein ONZ45_g11063 [Pleurotus djamor]|nr:hypothetical protein ONZ45_g11063 [Pleurotus djamor]
MNIGVRYFILVVGAVVCIHILLSYTHEEYGRVTSITNITSHFRPGQAESTVVDSGDVRIPVQNGNNANPPSPNPPTIHPPKPPTNHKPYVPAKSPTKQPQPQLANATLVILAKNSDADNLVRTIRDIEDRFNRERGYPYVFLTEASSFDAEFKSRISNLIRSKVEYGTIPRDMWDQPGWIDAAKAQQTRTQMDKDGIVFGGSLYHRNMWRFRAGVRAISVYLSTAGTGGLSWSFSFNRLQVATLTVFSPGTHYLCNMDDPFLFMEKNNKVFGFTMTLYEFGSTITSLWGHVKDFMNSHPEHVSEDNAMDYLSDDGGGTYNRCHFWSNFQIGDMDFWRSAAYQDYFKYLDEKGGFYYERWADAPIHSIAAALFARKDQIHFFDEIGYENNPYIHCTQNNTLWAEKKCACGQNRNFDYDGYSRFNATHILFILLSPPISPNPQLGMMRYLWD